MWSDNETNIDYLNHSEVAEIICTMIADDSLLPLSIGVYGGWGVGKSSILQLVNAQLSQEDEVIVIEFDAWLYQGFDEAKSALMTVITQALISEAPNDLKDKALGLFRRVNKLKLLGLGAEASMAMFGLPAFGFAAKAANSVGNAVSGEGTTEELEAINEGVMIAIPDAPLPMHGIHELFNINRSKLEKLIHRIFESAKIDIEIRIALVSR